MNVSIETILQRKREGHANSSDEIHAFVKGVVDGDISRPQAAAWLAFAFLNGLDFRETVALTRAMVGSGRRLDWNGLSGPFIDKHSTGGVGDKVSLVLAPLWVELGCKVPMISGRGLGFTGGTLDKLESIPGYRCDLDSARLRVVLRDIGCFISGQTGELAPADGILYALRNETSTVPSIPLITASILSKKICEGVEKLVLDVKVGSGAFMKDLPSARRLAESLVKVGNGYGLDTKAVLSDMGQPLGLAVGNAIEVMEAVDCLKGGGPGDLFDLTVRLADHPDALETLRSGAAYERFCAMVAAQGGDVAALSTPTRMMGPVEEWVLEARQSGHVIACDAIGVAKAAFYLGAGRSRAEQSVSPGVGVLLHHKVGDHVEQGEPLAVVYHLDSGLERARKELSKALLVGPELPSPRELVLEEFVS